MPSEHSKKVINLSEKQLSTSIEKIRNKEHCCYDIIEKIYSKEFLQNVKPRFLIEDLSETLTLEVTAINADSIRVWLSRFRKKGKSSTTMKPAIVHNSLSSPDFDPFTYQFSKPERAPEKPLLQFLNDDD